MNALLRILAWTLAVALVVLPVVALLNGWVASDRWPLRTLRVQGTLRNVDEQQLRATVLPFAKRGFFAVRLKTLSQRSMFRSSMTSAATILHRLQYLRTTL